MLDPHPLCPPPTPVDWAVARRAAWLLPGVDVDRLAHHLVERREAEVILGLSRLRSAREIIERVEAQEAESRRWWRRRKQKTRRL